MGDQIFFLGGGHYFWCQQFCGKTLFETQNFVDVRFFWGVKNCWLRTKGLMWGIFLTLNLFWDKDFYGSNFFCGNLFFGGQNFWGSTLFVGNFFCGIKF